ncbi:MAG: hypothetical protein WCI20_12590, partial [bacterium]
FERIYVMYGKYVQWSAKAYLARAECLNRLSLYNKATETLQEMVSISDMKTLPEFAEATKRLAEMTKQ